MTATDEIRTAVEDGVTWIQFHRPEKLNAATPTMEDALVAACAEAERDPDIGAVILHGTDGPKTSFMAGADIEGFLDVADADEVRHIESHSERTLQTIETLSKPTIAAMDGYTIGQGALIAAACDIRLTGPSTRFGFPIAKTVGNCLSIQNLDRLVALVGVPTVKQMLLTAQLIDAQDLHRLGAVISVAETHEALLEEADDLAHSLCQLAPTTLNGTKRSLERWRRDHLTADNEDIVIDSYLSDYFRQAVERFGHKRQSDQRFNA